MAIGILQNGVLSGLSPLGSVSVRSGISIPSQYWATNMRRVTPRGHNQCYDYLNLLAVRQGIPDPRYSNSPRVCGEGDALPCMTGASASGLAGLGSVSNFICGDWADIMTQMQVLLAKAEEKGVSTPAYLTARAYFDDNTGVFQKPILSCASHTATAKQMYNALLAEVGGVPSLSTIVDPSTNPTEDKVVTAIKYGAIALAALAGAYALGPIFRGIGGLIPKKGR